MRLVLRVYGAVHVRGTVCASLFLTKQQCTEFLRLRDMLKALTNYESRLYSFELLDSLPMWHVVSDSVDVGTRLTGDGVLVADRGMCRILNTSDKLDNELGYAVITEKGVHWTCMEKHNVEDHLETVSLPWAELEKV